MRKSILYIPFLLILEFVGCCRTENDGGVIFLAEVSDIQSYSAMVMITHNATNRDAYYGFVKEGVVEDVNCEISNYLAIVDAETLRQNVHFQRKSYFKIAGLLPNTVYTFIVFGMNDNGFCYGRPSSIVFTTAQSNTQASTNSNWEIEYKGHVVYNDLDYSLFQVNVKNDVQERYFFATYPLEQVVKYETVEDFIGFATAEMLNQNNEDRWFDSDKIRTESSNFYQYLNEGDYVSYAIGISEDAVPTGHYVRTDVYHVEKYPTIPSYANLLGAWTLIDNEYKEYEICLSEDVVNRSLIMSGWGNYSDQPIPIVVSFNRNDGSISISNQLIYNNYKRILGDGTILEGTLIIRGTYLNKEGLFKIIDNKPVEAYLTTDSCYVFPGFTVTSQDGSTSYKTGISLFLQGNKTIWDATMMFPITMEKRNL